MKSVYSIRKTCLRYFLLMAVFCSLYSNAQSVQWLRTMGGTGYDDCYSVTHDGSGNIYATGFFSVSATFGAFTLTSPSSGNCYITKINEFNGNVIWAKKYGTSGSIGYSMITDASGNLFLAGNFYGTTNFDSFTVTSSGFNDAFIAKIDPVNGNVVWLTQYSGPGDDTPYSITCDITGNIYATGSFFNSLQSGTITLTSSGSRDVFITKLNPANGNILWLKKLGGSMIDEARGISCDSLGNVYNTGGFEGTATFGTYTFTSAGGTDIFVNKIDPATGNITWAKQFGGAGNDYGTAISCDVAGNIYATGCFSSTVAFDTFTQTASGASDVFICKYEPVAGNVQWAKRYGTSGFNIGTSISLDSFGNIYTVGSFSAAVNFGNNTLVSFGSYDAFVVRTDAATGNGIAALRFGGSGYDNGRSVTVNAAGNIFVAGSFPIAANFENYNPNSVGSNDIFVLKLDKTIGLNEEKTIEYQIDCSPNPFNNFITVSVKQDNSQIRTIAVIDLSGKILLQESKQNETTAVLNLSLLAPGIYFITITGESGERTIRKIIKTNNK